MARKLTGKEKTFEGYIIDLKVWSKGNGYFLNIDSMPIDFYGFGSCNYKLGDTIRITAAQGTGAFADKMEVYKIEALTETTMQDYQTQKPGQTNDLPQKAEGVNIYVEKQDMIIQQSCMKAAAEIVSHLCGNKKIANSADADFVAEMTLRIKRKFYEDILGIADELEAEENAGASASAEP